MKVNLTPKNKRKLSNENIKDCEKLIQLLYIQPLLTAKKMAEVLGTEPINIRKTVQMIREQNDLFLKDSFLISKWRGYKISTNKKEIAQWAKGRHTRAKSGLQQVDQAWKITEKSW